MADDLDVQRVFERFNAKPEAKRRLRRRLSLFPWVPMQAGTTTPSNALNLNGEPLTLNDETLTLGV